MLNIKQVVCNMLQENCYIVSDESRECVIIDCGAYYKKEKDEILDYIRQNNLTPRWQLATHGHFDHNIGNAFAYEAFGTVPYVHKADAQQRAALRDHAANMARIDVDDPTLDKVRFFGADAVFPFGSHRLTVLETPGHSEGSVFLYCVEEGVAFSGDTLFHRSIGRTDFDGGSMFQMIQSLRQISQLPDTTRLYPGHGRATTLGDELAFNPYLDR